MKVPFYKPSIGEEEAKAVYDVVKSGWLTFGKKTEEFEKKFAEYINAPFCVMVDNCTAALTLACEYEARNIDRRIDIASLTVSVPSLTCAATALAPYHAGFSVKFTDLEESNSFLSRIAEDVDYVIPVHFAGKRDGDQQAKILIEDCAHRIIRDGFSGNLQAYSFYVTKCMTTGEGGMIACRTQEEANWFRQARLYGNNKAIFERDKMYQSGNDFWWFESSFMGWKANPTDLAAVIGLVQLEKLDEMNLRRDQLANRYNKAFGLTTDRSPWHLYPILVNDRDEFMHHMRDSEVYCSVHFPPLHMMEGFKNDQRVSFGSRGSLDVTENIYKHIVSLPLYPDMTFEEQDYVIGLTQDWIKNHGSFSIAHSN